MIKTLCAKFRKQNHPNNTLFVFLLTRGRLFVTKCTFLHTLISIIYIIYNASTCAFFNITDVFCAKKRVKHACMVVHGCICPRIDTCYIASFEVAPPRKVGVSKKWKFRGETLPNCCFCLVSAQKFWPNRKQNQTFISEKLSRRSHLSRTTCAVLL